MSNTVVSTPASAAREVDDLLTEIQDRISSDDVEQAQKSAAKMREHDLSKLRFKMFAKSSGDGS